MNSGGAMAGSAPSAISPDSASIFGLFTTIGCLPVIVAVRALQAGIAVMGRARSPGSAGRPGRSEQA